MSGFMDKAKEALEDVKDKAEGLVDKAKEAMPDGVMDKAEGMLDKAKDAVEKIIPGDSDGDGK
jgi:uncharacterized protein YjbJ (UPF0337 family)